MSDCGTIVYCTIRAIGHDIHLFGPLRISLVVNLILVLIVLRLRWRARTEVQNFNPHNTVLNAEVSDELPTHPSPIVEPIQIVI